VKQLGTVLKNVFDENDKIVVSADRKITVSIHGNNSKIYVVDEDLEDRIPVTFMVDNAKTNWGENLYISGNCNELGNWDVEKAAGPAICLDYPKWTLTTYLPAGSKIEFKAIKKDSYGKVLWQQGENRSYFVPSSGQGNVIIEW